MARKTVAPKLIEVDIHQHDLANFLMCPRKFHLSRTCRPRRIKKALNIGDLFARSVYWLHQGKDVEECILYVRAFQDELEKIARSQAEVDELATNVIVAQSMIYGYDNKFIKEYKGNIPIITKLYPEHHVTVPIIAGGYKFNYINRLDGLIIDSFGNPWILELKTTSMFDNSLSDKLPTNFQINSYWYSLFETQQKPIAGVLYRYILKSSLRQRTKKNPETVEQFQKRIMLDYEKYPDEYMKEISLWFNSPNIVEFKKDMQIYINELVRAFVLNKWEKRGTACDSKYGMCEYIQYCGNPTEETLNTYYEKVA
jgi:hypothetical protein